MRARLVARLGALVALAAGGCASTSGTDDPTRLPDLAEAPFVEPEPEEDLAEPADLRMRDMAGPANQDLSMPASGTCNPANETLGAAGGPDICAYGQRCDDPTDTCKPAPVGTCTNASGAPTWSTAAKMAPVITRATASLLATTSSTTECANGDPAALVTIDF
jgi:hypothetical protein